MAVTTGKVGICNAALIRLGENTISSFAENSLESTACSLLWDSSLEEVLQLHPWNFAIKRSSWTAATQTGGLSKTAAATPVNKEYKYAYTLPSDCIQLIKFYGSADYKIEGREILSNDEECHVKYVYNVTDTTLFSPIFRKVMEAKMALELSYTIVRAGSMIDRMAGMYERALMVAKSKDAQEDIQDAIDQFAPDLISVRYSGSR